MVLESLVQLAVGRVILSYLPPGWPGYADRWELGATLSASWMLGALGFGLVPLWWAWTVLLALRVATLPGALRPRHGRPLAWGIVHGLALVLCLATQGSGFGLGLSYALPALWVVTASAVWFTSADRRARALGLLAVAALVFEGVA